MASQRRLGRSLVAPFAPFTPSTRVGRVVRTTAARAATLTAALVAAACVLAVGGGTAVAAPIGRVDQVSAGAAGRVSIVFGAAGLAAGQSIDPASVQVTIDGQPVAATARPFGDTDVRRAALLVIDTSGSMRGAGLAGARTAAESFLSTVPADVEVGLVTFADTARVVSNPTTDRAVVRSAVARLQARGRTALYDGIATATTTLGSAGSRTIVLLSDGNDTASRTTLAAATAAVRTAQVRLDAVSLGKAQQAQSTALAAATRAGGGQVLSVARPAELEQTFRSAAQVIASQVLVDAAVPPALAGTSQTIAVTARAGDVDLTDQVAALLPAAATPTASPGGTGDQGAGAYGPREVAAAASVTSEPWFLPVALGAVGLGLLVLLVTAFVGPGSDATSGRVGRRLSRYSLTARQPEPTQPTGSLGTGPVARSAVDLAGRVVQRSDLDTTLGTRLDAAGVPLRPAEWMLVHVGAPIALGLALLLVTGFNPLAGLIGVAVGVLAPFAYLSVKEGRRKAAFAAQLADTLQLLAGSLAAGYSLAQATDVVVRESAAPMSTELNRALVEARLGVPLEDALDTVAARMDNVDLAWVVMAIRIQREVGGNLAEVLGTVAATLRERERLRRQVRVLSAEGRLSAAILFGLPILFVVYLALVRPEYLLQLVTDPLGIVMSVVGLMLLVAGGFWLRKVVRVEV